MSHTVKVGNTHMQSGCHIDGSHNKTEDYLVAVIEFAERLGYESEGTGIVACYQGTCTAVQAGNRCDDTFHLEGLIEESDRAEAWLNEVTEDDFVWHTDEQSLFLSDRQELEMDGHLGPVYPERGE